MLLPIEKLCSYTPHHWRVHQPLDKFLTCRQPSDKKLSSFKTATFASKQEQQPLKARQHEQMTAVTKEAHNLSVKLLNT